MPLNAFPFSLSLFKNLETGTLGTTEQYCSGECIDLIELQLAQLCASVPAWSIGSGWKTGLNWHYLFTTLNQRCARASEKTTSALGLFHLADLSATAAKLCSSLTPA